MNFNSKTINSNVKNIKGNNNIIVDNSINVNNKEKFLLTVIQFKLINIINKEF